MTPTLQAALVFGCVSGIISGAIAYSRTGKRVDWTLYWLIGFVLPILGIVLALFVKRPHPAVPGWYVDPVDARFVRWWDGRQYVGPPQHRHA